MYADSSGHDAILIAEYLPYGLPIVGHSVLLVQDENGEWWITEYSGSFPNSDSATVVCRKATLTDFERFFSKKRLRNLLNNIFPLSGNSLVYLNGDYNVSLDMAKKLKGTNFG